MQIFRLRILRFYSRTFFDFSSDFFTLSFFNFEWSLLPWSKANIKPVAEQERIMWSVAQRLEVVAVNREVSGSGPGGGGGVGFLHP